MFIDSSNQYLINKTNSLLYSNEPYLIPPSFHLDGYKLGADTDNIVLQIGSSGSWDDNKIIIQSIVRQAGTIYLYYSGRQGIVQQVGVATAPVSGFTGKNFTKLASNPINLNGANTVLYDTSESIWKAWYGYSGGVGYATATNPLGDWTDYGGNPIMLDDSAWENNAIAHVRILKESNTDYKMLYTGGSVVANSQIGLATSSDGITWVKEPTNPVLSPSGSDWMSLTTFCPTIPVKISGIYYIYFNGKYIPADPSDYSRIGFAYSANLINWVVNPANSGAILNATRTWEGINSPPGEVENPVYIQVNGIRYLYYDCWWGNPSTIGVVAVN